MAAIKLYLAALKYLGLYGFPIFSSSYAIQQKDEQQQYYWLLYWIFFGLLSLVESVLCLSCIPGWTIIKSLFAVWLYLPRYKGCLWLQYNLSPKFKPIVEKAYSFLKPIFEQSASESQVQSEKKEN